MPEIVGVSQRVQVGIEVTPGVVTPANKRLAALSIGPPSPKGDVKMHRALGYLYDTVATTGRQWTEAALAGTATYNELVYPLSSLVRTAAITTPTGATLARQWVFTPSPTGNDPVSTLTVEYGDDNRARSFGFGFVNALDLNLSRETVEIGGSMMGQKMASGITMTPTPTQLDLIPVQGDDVDVFMDALPANIGTTKLLRVFETKLAIGDRADVLWPLNSALPSFAARVEKAPKVELTGRIMADAVGDALNDSLNDNSTRYVRIKAIGPLIEGTIFHSLQLDFAGKLSAVPDLGINGEVLSYSFAFAAVADATLGYPFRLTLVNKLSAL